MNRPDVSLGADYFEGMFAGDDDPWRFATSPYETAKFACTVEALAGRTYLHAFEVGCANGVLTRCLAAHCRQLLAIDISPSALAAARIRCADIPHACFQPMAFPAEAPVADSFDLIVLSEVAYYWSDADLAFAALRIETLLAADGDLLLVHWTGETDYPQTGDGAVGLLQVALGGKMDPVTARREDQYRLDLWRRR